jgi:hypothetical protein
MHINYYLFMGATFALSVAAFPGVLSNTAPTLIGPIYLPDSSSQALSGASSESYDAITEAIKTGASEYGPVDNQTTSFSIAVFSAATNETLFEYNFEAPQLNGSLTKGKLTENTVYRTGSLGKLFIMFLFLADIGDSVFLDSVTKYLVSSECRRHIDRDIHSNFNCQFSLSFRKLFKLCLVIQYDLPTGKKSP